MRIRWQCRALCVCFSIFELCSSISETRVVKHSVQFRDPNPGPGMSVLCRLAFVAHERFIAKCPAALCTRTYSVTWVRALPSQPLSIWADQVDDSSLKFPETQVIPSNLQLQAAKRALQAGKRATARQVNGQRPVPATVA